MDAFEHQDKNLHTRYTRVIFNMTGFDKKATGGLMRADHERSMPLILGNGGIIHPFYSASSSRTQGGAILGKHQQTIMQKRSDLALVCILSFYFVGSFLLSQNNLHRMVVYHQKHFRSLTLSTSTTTSSSKYSSSSYDTLVDMKRSKEESLETFVVQDDLFNYNSKVLNNEQTFALEHLGQIRGCGGKKCFFRLKSNQQVGYLMAHEGARPFFSENIYEEFNQTWTLAKRLQQDYNVSTLLLGPPQELSGKDNHFLEQLNARLATDHREDEKKGIRVSTERALVVQKVQVAPKPNMLWQMWGEGKSCRKI
jgi:hypothetical protein